MRAFVKDVCEAFSDGDRIMENIDWNDDSLLAVDNCYETVLADLERCTHDMFLPWKSKPTNANRHYFVQEGGMDLLAAIYNFASKKRYPLTIWYVRRYGAGLAWSTRYDSFSRVLITALINIQNDISKLN
jgi:hypothetical protein